MDKLFLLDAYALIYRAYYAFIKNPRINSKGMNTSAVMGFVNTLNEILTKEHPTHIGVAFDHGKTFRDEAFPAYKAQREETPEDIRASVPVIKDIITAMNIPVLQADGFEADDVIGTLATKAGAAGIETYMLTPDKDSRVAMVDGQPVPLTRKESSVLEYLLLHQGRPVSQEELMEHVWDGRVDAFSNSIRVHISALRKKLRAALGYDPIRNRIGEGYEVGESEQ